MSIVHHSPKVFQYDLIDCSPTNSDYYTSDEKFDPQSLTCLLKAEEEKSPAFCRRGDDITRNEKFSMKKLIGSFESDQGGSCSSYSSSTYNSGTESSHTSPHVSFASTETWLETSRSSFSQMSFSWNDFKRKGVECRKSASNLFCSTPVTNIRNWAKNQSIKVTNNSLIKSIAKKCRSKTELELEQEELMMLFQSALKCGSVKIAE
eukprot:293756-Hanusia_phi.AAC.3